MAALGYNCTLTYVYDATSVAGKKIQGLRREGEEIVIALGDGETLRIKSVPGADGKPKLRAHHCFPNIRELTF